MPERDAPRKAVYKEMISTKMTVNCENKLRKSAAANQNMKYLNVSASGLRGRHHPALSNLETTHEVKIARQHTISFLAII